VVYFSKPLEARHEFITANNNTPYVMTVLDLHDGPRVLEVPPASDKIALFGSAIDSFEVPLVDVGPTGTDAGKGGKYLFLPPGYIGTASDGYFVIPSTTNFLHVALRPIIGKGATIEDGVAAPLALSSSWRSADVTCRTEVGPTASVSWARGIPSSAATSPIQLPGP
jgi:hypothetical protein